MKTKLTQSFVACFLIMAIAEPIWGQAPVQDEKHGARLMVLADRADELPCLTKRLADEDYRVRRLAQHDLSESLDGYAAVIVYVHKPLLPPVETALIEYARDGGRLVVLHHAIASAKIANPKWLEFLGVSMAPRNAESYPWTVSAGVTFTMVNLAPQHYITTHGVSYDQTVDYRSPDREELRGRFAAFALQNTEIFHNQQTPTARVKQSSLVTVTKSLLTPPLKVKRQLWKIRLAGTNALARA